MRSTSRPHAPSRLVHAAGTYIITARTYQKEHFFNTDEKLDQLEGTLITTLTELGWDFHAWAVFRNH